MARERKVWIWVIIAAAGAAVLMAAFLFDPIVRDWMLNHRNRDLRIAMAAVSRYGDWPEHVVLGLLLLSVAWWRKNTRWARIFLAMLIACAIAGAAARVLKIGTGRARPSVKTESAWNGPRLAEKYHAFPSGHMAASTAFFAVLAFVSWRIGLACAAIPLLIGFSRMYVAAHYLSDVVFAAFLGVLCAYVVAKAMKLTVVPDGSG
ncbi:MAG: phosphatase PAP2 family protein [Chthoniobacterales bacterium]